MQIVEDEFESAVARSRGLRTRYSHDPGAHAQGFMLSPAFAGSGFDTRTIFSTQEVDGGSALKFLRLN